MNVVIVEDEPNMQRLFRELLEPFSKEIRATGTIGGAIEILDEMQRVDLVILDLKLDDSRDPRTTAQQIPNIKRMHPECAVMVVSGMLWADNLYDICQRYGADVITEKTPETCKRDALLTGVLKAMESREKTEEDDPEFVHRINLIESVIARSRKV